MYKFEFENILKVRQHIEDSLQSELSSINQVLKRETTLIEQALDKKEKLKNQLQKKSESGASSGEYILFSGFINKVNQDIETQVNHLKDTEYKLKKKREELLMAVKNRKALEKLKEQRAAEFKIRQNKTEMDNLDDFSSIRHARGMEAT